MSYDIYFEAPDCPTCGACQSAEVGWSPTYNLTPIFDLALTGEPLPNPEVNEAHVVLLREKTDRPRGLRVLTGKTGAESQNLLADALARTVDRKRHPAFVALNPSNGWGNFEDAVKVLAGLLELAAKYPAHVWRVH